MKTTIAKDLLSIKAVFFRPEEPFIWASGIKSPVYKMSPYHKLINMKPIYYLIFNKREHHDIILEYWIVILVTHVKNSFLMLVTTFTENLGFFIIYSYIQYIESHHINKKGVKSGQSGHKTVIFTIFINFEQYLVKNKSPSFPGPLKS